MRTAPVRRRSRSLAIATITVATALTSTARALPQTTWDNQTFNFDQSLAAGSNIQIVNGLTLNATLHLLNGTATTLLNFTGSQTFTGNGTVLIDNGSSGNIHRL